MKLKLTNRLGGRWPIALMAALLLILGGTAVGLNRHSNKTQPKPSADTAKIIPTLIPTRPLATTADSSISQATIDKYSNPTGDYKVSRLMIFTNIPDSAGTAVGDASDMAGQLKKLTASGLKPLVVMEPTDSNGSINFASYAKGGYDSILDKYFSSLKTSGLSDAQMGMWVYFPEANLPEWGAVDVTDFAPSVVRTVNLQKKYFPASQASIMLDAESYPAGSSDWGTGSYTSLLPFVTGIPAGLLDSFGLQGFPWAPPAGQKDAASYDPSVYLNGGLAAEVAKHLGVSSIWLNTGTFAAMYTNNKSQTVTMPDSQRQSLLQGVLGQAAGLRRGGFAVAVNLFSEDKSATSEATNWAYQTDPAKAVLTAFGQQLSAQGIELWQFNQ